MIRLASQNAWRIAGIFLRSMVAGAFVIAAAQASAANNGKRVALVIGNSTYQSAGTLANPANDAEDIAAALKELNFTVVTGTDLNNRGMRDKIREFASELRGAEVAMFFYAGHAIQVNGKNYLAPIDTKLEFESDVDFETIPVEFVERQMEREVDTILLFLDACRDNPITRSLKAASRSGGAGKGLAEEKLSAAGTLIAFSTDPGNVALDGKGRNSPFAKALIANIRRPGVEISTMMTDVRVQVREETNNAQTPWTNSSLLGHFYFNPLPAGSTGEKVAALGSNNAQSNNAAAAPPLSGGGNASAGKVDDARVAALAWDSVKDTESQDALEFFISKFGDTFYGGLAQLRLNRLKAAKADSGAKPEATAETSTKGEETKQPEQTAATSKEAATEPETKVASLEPKESARSIEPTFDLREVTRAIQQRLARLNCDPGTADGLWGKRTEGALRNFSRAAKVKLASAEPNPDLLNQLQSYSGSGCPVVCSVKQNNVGGRCVAKTCPGGQLLSSKGNCYTPRQREATVQPEPQNTRRLNRRQVIMQGQPQDGMIMQQDPQMVPQRQVIIQQQQPVFIEPQPQPQPQQGPGVGRLLLGVGACIAVGC